MLAFGVLPYHVCVTRELPPGGALSSGGLSPMENNSSRSRSRKKTCAVSELVGASEETGGVFDPLGLATDEVRDARGTAIPACAWVLLCGVGGIGVYVLLVLWVVERIRITKYITAAVQQEYLYQY